MRTTLTESELQDLAWALVGCRPLRPWAAERRLDVMAVYDASVRPDVVNLVAIYGSRLRAKTAAWLDSLSPPVIDQFLALAQRLASAEPKPPERPRSSEATKLARRRELEQRLADLQRRLGKPPGVI
jgi:hypothetical protein